MTGQDGTEAGTARETLTGDATERPSSRDHAAGSSPRRSQADDFRILQNRALELAAEERPLHAALDELMRTVETRSSNGVIGSILLLDADGSRLLHGAGPSLPDGYNAAIDGIAIGPGIGSCGTAAFENRPVYVSDIATDPLWADFRELALSHGLRACWSTPILSSRGAVLGTFAMYYREPREPSPADLDIVHVITRAAALIIERRRTGAALLESEERLRLAIENAEIGLWDVDPIHDILIWPARTKAMFGISADVPVTMQDFYDGLHPDDRGRTSAAYAAATDPERRALYDVEYRTIGKEDGIIRWVAAKGRGIFDAAGTCVRVIGTAINVTERKRIEADLRASEARRLALDADLERQVVDRASERALLWQISPDLLSVIDLSSGNFDRVNPAWKTTLGWSAEEMNGQPYEQFVHPDDLGISAAALDQIRAGAPVLRFENRLRSKHAGWRWLSWVAVPEGSKIYSTTRDITERKKQTEALAAATAERDRAWRLAQDLLVSAERDGTFIAINLAWTKLLGWEEADIVGRSFTEFTHPDDLERTLAAVCELTETSLVTPFVFRFRAADGSYRWFAWTGAFEDGRVYASGRDVTAEREQAAELAAAEEALRQSQKMEAVGQLTGGIAHDFNNMLAVVIGSLDLLDRRIGASDMRSKRYVDAATDGARRAALLTQRLLAFSRQQPLKPESVDANKLVAGMSDLLRHSLGGDARLETVLAGGLWRTHADPNQLENVILNLAINGRDAMPSGGRLTIETANCHLDARYVAAHVGVPAGQYVMIAVTDTGSGMPPEVIAKAFDPFFTTKQVGKGTGLGLSQVYGFVKQSGGHVKIYSEPGQGTTIKVYLPRLVSADAELDDDAAVTEMPLGEREEVVLVVEDEPAVRQWSVDALSELGYRVLEADGAKLALRLLDAHPEVALLFTDIVMPNINGAKLAEEARRRRPDLRVLFTTGYSRNAIVHNGVLDNGVELIGKPFTIEELAAKVRAVLDAPGEKAAVGQP